MLILTFKHSKLHRLIPRLFKFYSITVVIQMLPFLRQIYSLKQFLLFSGKGKDIFLNIHSTAIETSLCFKIFIKNPADPVHFAEVLPAPRLHHQKKNSNSLTQSPAH